MNFTGAQQNIINYINSTIINKGNVVVGDVPTFNSDCGFKLMNSFRLTFPDFNHTNSDGFAPEFALYCTNASTSSILMFYNKTTNINRQPNPFGEGLIFIRQE